MTKLLPILLLILSMNVSGQTFFSKDSTHLKITDDGHTFEITITRTPFDEEKNDVSKIKENIINGSPAWGIDWSIPRYELESISLKIDEVEIPIADEFYKFCYNPNLGKGYFNAYWGKDYKSVFVFMSGSDGAGGYTIAWFLSADGDHSYMIPRYDDFMFKSEW